MQRKDEKGEIINNGPLFNIDLLKTDPDKLTYQKEIANGGTFIEHADFNEKNIELDAEQPYTSPYGRCVIDLDGKFKR